MNKKTVLSVLFAVVAMCAAAAQEFNPVPRAWKWIDDDEVIFTFNGIYTDSTAFVMNSRTGEKTVGVKSPARYFMFPVRPEGAVNMTYSPDSTTYRSLSRVNAILVESGE